MTTKLASKRRAELATETGIPTSYFIKSGNHLLRSPQSAKMAQTLVEIAAGEIHRSGLTGLWVLRSTGETRHFSVTRLLQWGYATELEGTCVVETQSGRNAFRALAAILSENVK